MDIKKASSRATWILFASIVSMYFIENISAFEMNENLRIICIGILTGILGTTTKELRNKIVGK